VSSLIQVKNSFGLIFVSDLVSAAYRLAQQAGVPVVGAAIDGPEWGTQPNTNMVAVSGDQSPTLPTYTYLPKAAQLVGAKNMASLAIANEQPSIVGAEAFVTAAKSLGLNVGYRNYSIPIGSVDATATVLAMKQTKVDGFISYMLNTTDFAIMEGAKQAGINLVAPMDFTSYTQDLLDNPTALAAAQGIIVDVAQVPVEEHTPATEAQQAAFETYEHFSGVPNLNWTYGWLSADLFIKGMQEAGQNPTRASFLNALRNTTGWTANGLLARSPDFSLKDFGTAPTTACAYFVQLHGSAYTPLNGGQPICGNEVK
jgi:ABC-type branched-subunit amino acid transport system substrate-binding protein